MHTMWKGAVSFGLVSVPVRMFAATESKDIKLRYLHQACKTPLQYTRTCPHCDRAVEWEEIVRGFEYEPNRFVIIDEDELKSVGKSRSQTIDIVDFVELTEIDPVYFDKTYYIAPETTGIKAYRLLQAAMQETGKIAVAKTVLRNAETLACVRTHKDLLVVETLFWPDEVRATDELPNRSAVADAHVDAKELQMAVTLVSQLATAFDPGRYVDERRAALDTLIAGKVASSEVAQAPVVSAQRENIVDLMQALQESIRRSADAGRTDKPAPKRAAGKSGTVAGKSARPSNGKAESVAAPTAKRARAKRTSSG
ncbi:non-homologous end joining protein Ku [Alicyclobacillus sp. ALC3]|uniref:non-homologous end joining protein Ku n=1 Tax=Alicyclobacillus sp. ALC3 TaxID=2796143 RepID=UPI0023799A86|nr:Ku protein [Alicyclobacillus sp. ALC3]WDL97228.1 Ku protein [Alicyclobacillus sp. ALC3]